MTLLDAILAIALVLPRPADSEPAISYASRLQTISLAIVAETENVPSWRWSQSDLAAAVLVTAYFESRFSYAVHAGLRFGDSNRAACVMQLHATPLVQLPVWRTLTGVDLDSTRRCIRAGVTVLSHCASRCLRRGGPLTRDRMARVLSAYGTGRCGRAIKSSVRRAAAWSRIAAKLRSSPSPSAYARTE